MDGVVVERNHSEVKLQKGRREQGASGIAEDGDGATTRCSTWGSSVTSLAHAAVAARIHSHIKPHPLCSHLMPKPIKPDTAATDRNMGFVRSGSDQTLCTSPVTSIIAAMKGRESILL